ncbi:hypothetical protein ACWDKQ_17310 [Saccharopolyspora sp. NPDC000995]
MDGDLIASNTTGIAACRKRSTSSMLSVPATIAATRERFRHRIRAPTVTGPGDAHRVNDQLAKPGPFRQPQHRNQPGIRDQIPIKNRTQPRRL